jgi:hypothetical protein
MKIELTMITYSLNDRFIRFNDIIIILVRKVCPRELQSAARQSPRLPNSTNLEETNWVS